VSLSVCLLTAHPAPRVAALLEPLRPYADEVVIAADARVDEDTLGGYAALADRVFAIDYSSYERHLAWLHAQCSGDWILRLDGDELPSDAFIKRLPELLATRRVQQYWVARAWLFPDAHRILAGEPWATDFLNRLVRNDGTLRFTGQMHAHAEPVAPAEYVEEPVYHLNLLTTSRQERREKAVRYEVQRPHLLAAGGGRMNEAIYLPELRRSLPTRPTPAEDHDSIARALDAATPLALASTSDVTRISLHDTYRWWEGRAVSDNAYQAHIEPLAPTLSLAPGEWRNVFLRVSNNGSERWPFRLEEQPLIRLAHRWLDPDGAPLEPHGARTPFPRVVEPGERVTVPVAVLAPSAPGDYLLEVDVVHELVRWFDCPRQLPARVERPDGLAPAGPRLTPTRPPRAQRLRRQRIPRIIHRVWLGDDPMPDEHVGFAATIAAHHPGWRQRLWTDENLPALGINATERARSRTHAELSNLARYEILHRHGGVYLDTDVACQRPLDPLLRGIDAFAALELPGRVGNAVIGAIPHHHIFARASREARETLGLGSHSPDANGPYFLSLIIEQEQSPTVAIFGPERFYPYLWDEPERRDEQFPDAHTVHHWAGSGRSPAAAVTPNP